MIKDRNMSMRISNNNNNNNAVENKRKAPPKQQSGMSKSIECLLDRTTTTTTTMTMKTKTSSPAANQMSNEIFIRSRFISNRPKSPFRKYEQCIKNATCVSTSNANTFSSRKVIIIPTTEDQTKDDFTIKQPYVRYKTNCTVDLTDSPKRSGSSRPVITRVRFDTSQTVEIKKEIPVVIQVPAEKDYHNTEKSDKIDKIDKTDKTSVELNPQLVDQFIDVLIAEDKKQKLEQTVTDEKKHSEENSTQSSDNVVDRPVKLAASENSSNSGNNGKGRFYHKPSVVALADKNVKKALKSAPLINQQHKVTSLRDPAFSIELMQHPLIRNH